MTATAPEDARASAGGWRSTVRRVPVHLILPALVMLVLAFRAGGFFPLWPAIAAAFLAVALVGRVTLVERPFAGWSWAVAVPCAALAGLAVWTLLSATWSDAPGRALIEFNRVLLYLLVMVTAAAAPARPGSLGTLLRLTVAVTVAVALAGLGSRLLPELVDVTADYNLARLGFPITYWNALGILMAVGSVLCVHLTADLAERRVVRAAAAGALPLLATTLYFTFSRGAVYAAVVGVIAYIVLSRARGLPAALLSAVPAAAVAVWVAYGADRLATEEFASASDEGRRVAIVVAVCMVLAAILRGALTVLDARLDRITVARRTRRALTVAALAAALLVGAAAAAAFDLPDRVSDAAHAFTREQPVKSTDDLRRRLTAFNNNGRIVGWRVARDAFERAPWQGTGAGTFRLTWEEHRSPPAFKIIDAHSLYLETASELGVPGVALLVVALGGLLLAGLLRLRHRARPAHAAFVAAGGVLVLHAGVDWDWEMPALFVWFFAAGGVAAARIAGPPDSETAPAAGMGRLPRIIAALACLIIAVTPALVAVSESRLNRSRQAFARGDCRTAVDSALNTVDALRVRAEPFEILGYCDLRAGALELGVRAMENAVDRDPHNWQYAYGLAVARAIAGQDPRPEARRALALNPLDSDARDLARALGRTDDPARWRRIAGRANLPRS